MDNIFNEALFSSNKAKEKIMTFQKAKTYINKALIDMKRNTNFVKYSQLTVDQRKYIEEAFPPTLGLDIRKKAFVSGIELFYYEDKNTQQLSNVFAFVPKRKSAKKINFKKYMKVLEQSNIFYGIKGDIDMNIFDENLFVKSTSINEDVEALKLQINQVEFTLERLKESGTVSEEELEILGEGLFKKKKPFAKDFKEAKPAIAKAIVEMKAESVTFFKYNDLTHEERANIDEIFIEPYKNGVGTVTKTTISGVEILYTKEKLGKDKEEKISNVIGFKHGKCPYIVINYRNYMPEASKNESYDLGLDDLETGFEEIDEFDLGL